MLHRATMFAKPEIYMAASLGIVTLITATLLGITKPRNTETAKQRNGNSETKHRNTKTKHRNSETMKQQNTETAKQCNSETSKIPKRNT